MRICRKCGKPTKETVNDYCPSCWREGPAIEMLKWLNREHGFNIEIPNEDTVNVVTIVRENGKDN